ncbi:MAG: type II toxin-antitoxin system RelE/ParE family toxin [Alphaproteobacteria bacterium]|nr:type II toxin-antitoxin system RelE/ParE family toxin [Alphaproteobacteria bacterium]
MGEYVLSNKAADDLDGIYAYSFQAFGEAKADAYYLSLSDCLQNLADSPALGRSVCDLHAGLHCHHHASHLIFYLPEPEGIFVVRVLHDAMDAKRHIANEG